MVHSVVNISRRSVVQLVSCVLNAVIHAPVKTYADNLHCFAQLRYSCEMKLHHKARDGFYPGTNEGVLRFAVPDDNVPWSVKWTDYSPAVYTSDNILGRPWADPEIGDTTFKPKWNELDKSVDRKSHTGKYDLEDGYPRNPVGRTGLEGRGRLGRWGPNHAADPVVTRWKRDDGNDIVQSSSGSPILQFVAIQRKDSGEWALPGGMVDPGEKISATLQREFGEEALNSLELSDEEKAVFQETLDDFFQKQGEELYKGYVDDPRNTDNAWMETVAVNFHDETGETVGKFPLTAGDDAANVRWADLHSELQLYASHVDFLEMAAKLHNAHW